MTVSTQLEETSESAYRFEIESAIVAAHAALRSLRRAGLAAVDAGVPLEMARDEVDDVISCARRSTSALGLAIRDLSALGVDPS